MSEPTSPDDAAVGPPEHLHPLFLLTGFGGSLRGMAGGYAGIGYLAVSGRLQTALFGAVLLLLFMAVGAVPLLAALRVSRRRAMRSASTAASSTGPTARSRSTGSRTSTSRRDRSPGCLASPGSSSRPADRRGEEEGVLQAILLERAQELRKLVRSRRGQSAAVAADAPAEAAGRHAADLCDGFKRLLLAGTFNFSLAVFAGLFGLTQTFGDVLGFDPFSRSFWLSVLSAGDPIRDYHPRAPGRGGGRRGRRCWC